MANVTQDRPKKQHDKVITALCRFTALMYGRQEEIASTEQVDLTREETAALSRMTELSENSDVTLLDVAADRDKLAQAYYRLASRPELTDEDVQQMDEVLEKAESDSVLNFLIGEMDYLLAKRLSLLSEEALEHENQQAWLREYLGTPPASYPTEYRQEVQTLLKEKGYYEGKIDGVLGEETRSAIQAFQKASRLTVDGIPGLQTYVSLATNINYHERIQQLLAKKGFYDGEIDGMLGARTIAAILKAQGNQGLKADAMPGPRTYLALTMGDAYHKRVQKLLKQLGIYTGEIDGSIGASTEEALKAFQKLHQLNVDGIPGRNTYRALKKAASPPIAQS